MSNNLRGALFMSVCMAGFALADILSKMAYELADMLQVVLLRSLLSTMIVYVTAWRYGTLRHARLAFHPMVLLRAGTETGAAISFYAALEHLPLSTITAIMQSLPLAITFSAAVFFGEQVQWRRWLAIVVGFCGVLIVIRPDRNGISLPVLLILVSVAFCVVRDLATRHIPAHIPNLLISCVSCVTISATVAGAVALVPGDRVIAWEAVPLLSVAALVVVIGVQFNIMAMRVGQMSFVAPFRYTALLWAVVLSFAFFGEIPDASMIVGAIVIVGSGLCLLWQEVRPRPRPAKALHGDASGINGFPPDRRTHREGEGG